MEGQQHFDKDERYDEEAAASAAATGAVAQGDDAYEVEVLDPITPAEERLFSSRPSRPLGHGCWVSVPVYSE